MQSSWQARRIVSAKMPLQVLMAHRSYVGDFLFLKGSYSEPDTGVGNHWRTRWTLLERLDHEHHCATQQRRIRGGESTSVSEIYPQTFRLHSFFESACYIAMPLYICGFVLLGASLQNHLSVVALIFGWGIAQLGIMIATVSVCEHRLWFSPKIISSVRCRRVL